jgi:hypothetical protein
MNNIKFTSDIDIDFASRDDALKLLKHTPASMIKDDQHTKHNTGVYFTDIPINPLTGYASIDYEVAEERGYIKLDFLNVYVYGLIKSQDHLDKLLAQQPDWNKLYDFEFCKQLIHIGNHYNTLCKMPEKIDSILKLAMFLSVIRPSKRHLIGKSWDEVSKTVWLPDPNGGYQFKKSHSVAYGHLVVVHMNLLCDLPDQRN